MENVTEKQHNKLVKNKTKITLVSTKSTDMVVREQHARTPVVFPSTHPLQCLATTTKSDEEAGKKKKKKCFSRL